MNLKPDFVYLVSLRNEVIAHLKNGELLTISTLNSQLRTTDFQLTPAGAWLRTVLEWNPRAFLLLFFHNLLFDHVKGFDHASSDAVKVGFFPVAIGKQDDDPLSFFL